MTESRASGIPVIYLDDNASTGEKPLFLDRARFREISAPLNSQIRETISAVFDRPEFGQKSPGLAFLMQAVVADLVRRDAPGAIVNGA